MVTAKSKAAKIYPPNPPKDQVVCISGAFDPLNPGHVRLIQGAQYFGRVVVILNSDQWVIERRGYVLMPWVDRKEILMAIDGVSEVVPANDSDGTVCEALRKIMPAVFANGGSRTKNNTPERVFCKKHDIKMFWGIGGGEKDQYSAKIANIIAAVPAEPTEKGINE